MIASVMNAWNKDLVSEAKHPLNPGYGGGISRNAKLDYEIRNVHDYARCKDFEKKLASIDNETIPPTKVAARQRPILQSRSHTAHVLTKRITSNGIQV
jgi:hypothetical protein